MPTLAKAVLAKIDPKLDGSGRAEVLRCPINPESLKVGYANQIAEAKAEEAKDGAKPATPAPAPAAGGQFVSKLSTKLSVTLVLDVSVPDAGGVKDVRTLSMKVLGLLADPGSTVPPGVELLWGSFLFRGFLESVEETLEFFSPEGVPLRATLALSLTRPAFQTGENKGFRSAGGPGGRGGRPAPGTVPLAEAPAGGTVQGLVAQAKLGGGLSAGVSTGGGWQAVAAANGIDDPLRLKPGQRLDLSAGARVG